MAWRKITECPLCGNEGCSQATDNERMYYCFRFSKTHFVNKYQKGDVKRKVSRNKEKLPTDNQESFDFGGFNHYDVD